MREIVRTEVVLDLTAERADLAHEALEVGLGGTAQRVIDHRARKLRQLRGEGGLNAVFVDGTVRTIRYDAFIIWQRVCDRKDGLAVDVDG